MIETDKTKIIFLDVDGVLNEHRGEDATRNKTPDGFVGVEDKYLLQLMLIVEFTGASIVLSSDWKDEFGDNLCTYDDASNDGRYLLNRLSEFGLSIYERTDDRSIGTDMSTGRGYGIRKFLKSHPEVENYVILDDIPFSDFNGELKEHFVWMDEHPLCDEYTKKAIEILLGYSLSDFSISDTISY